MFSTLNDNTTAVLVTEGVDDMLGRDEWRTLNCRALLPRLLYNFNVSLKPTLRVTKIESKRSIALLVMHFNYKLCSLVGVSILYAKDNRVTRNDKDVWCM